MMSARVIRIALIALLAIFWAHFLWLIPTLDFDESLYRSISDSMKRSGNPWLLSWDAHPLFHKPPVLYWLIVASSWLVDFGKETISSLASRIPSILCSIGILFSLRAGMRFIHSGPIPSNEAWLPSLALLCSAFPMLTSGAVIFDPLQTLALLPALFIPARMFYTDEIPKPRSWLLVGMSLGLAAMIKGLNGILIPSFAIALHLVLSFRTRKASLSLRMAASFLGFALIPGAFFATVYFLVLHQKIGPDFTDEFFWVQHFGRSQSPMEAHSGGFLYHPTVLFLGGGFFTPLLVHALFQKRPDFSKIGFPLTYALAFVLAFSLSATKLPHYTWPAWPALALFFGLISIHTSANSSLLSTRSRMEWLIGTFSAIPVLVLGMVLLAMGAASDLIISVLSNIPRASSLLHSFSPLSGFQKLILCLGALSCFVFLVSRRRLVRVPELTAVFSLVALNSLSIGIAPSLEKIMVTPFHQVAEDLKAVSPQSTDCIRYSGPLSATLSLALGPNLLHNRCEPSAVVYLITPEWKAEECEDPGFQRVSQRGHLILCKKTIPRKD